MQLWCLPQRGSDLTETKPDRTRLNINKCSLQGLLQKQKTIGANDSISMLLSEKVCSKSVSSMISTLGVLVFCTWLPFA